MHDQVGIAADGRGEVGVFGQVQAEVSDIGRIVDCLCLASQHHVIHHRFMRFALGLVQDAVEGAGLDHLALGEADVEGAQEVGEGKELFLRWRVMHAVDQRGPGLLQRLGGRDIGQHHEFLDQLHGFQPLAIGDGSNLAVGAQHHPAFRQIEIQRIAQIARHSQGFVGGPDVRQGLTDRGVHVGVRIAVKGCLAPAHRSAAPRIA